MSLDQDMYLDTIGDAEWWLEYYNQFFYTEDYRLLQANTAALRRLAQVGIQGIPLDRELLQRFIEAKKNFLEFVKNQRSD